MGTNANLLTHCTYVSPVSSFVYFPKTTPLKHICLTRRNLLWEIFASGRNNSVTLISCLWLYLRYNSTNFFSDLACVQATDRSRARFIAYYLFWLVFIYRYYCFNKFQCRAIVQFRVRHDRWIKELKTHFFIALASIWSNIFTNSNEKKTCLLLSLLRIFKFQTLTCRNFWIFYFTSRLTLYECVVNVCTQR